MASEVKRGLIRIISNYARLLGTLVLGLILVRLLLGALGNDAYGLIALLGSTIGLSTMLGDVAKRSMIRELGAAYHSDDDEFSGVYNAGWIVSFVIGLLMLVIYMVIMLIVPLLSIPDALEPAARLFIAAKGVQSFVTVLLAPAFNMYLVKERMTAFNAWSVGFRAAQVAAAGIVAFKRPESIGDGIALYGALSAGISILLRVAAVAWIIAGDRRLRPALTRATRAGFRELVHVGGWNTAVITASVLHLELGAVIMNIAFGLFGNLTFGLAVTLGNYVRMIATGMTTGLDAVSGRLSVTRSEDAIRQLTAASTRLHGLVTFPASLIVFLLAEPLLAFWLGQRLEDPATALPPTVTLVRILSIGIVIRSISDAWTSILYGAGHIRRYAIAVVAGGIIDPVLACVLIWLLPESIGFMAVACAYSFVMLVVHAGIIPWIGGRVLGTGMYEILAPLWRPLLVTLACAPILLIPMWRMETWTLPRLGGIVGIFGAVYGALSLIFVVEQLERQRLMKHLMPWFLPGS